MAAVVFEASSLIRGSIRSIACCCHGDAELRSACSFSVTRAKSRFYIAAVDSTHSVVVGAHERSVQRHACEHSLSPRIAQYLGIHFPVSPGGGVASDWASSGRCVGTDLELVGKQTVHAFPVHDHEHVVDTFQADLHTPATPGDSEECRRTPSVFRAAGDDTLTAGCGNHKPSPDLMGNHRNAFGAFQHFLGYAFVGSIQYLVQNISGVLEPGFGFHSDFACPARVQCHGKNNEQEGALFHKSPKP